MKRYLEIVEKSTKEVVERLDVTDSSDSTIDRIERGMNINLNRSEYSTRQVESEKELPKIE